MESHLRLFFVAHLEKYLGATWMPGDFSRKLACELHEDVGPVILDSLALIFFFSTLTVLSPMLDCNQCYWE